MYLAQKRQNLEDRIEIWPKILLGEKLCKFLLNDRITRIWIIYIEKISVETNVAACFETGGSKIEHSGINVLCNRFIIGWETIAIWHARGIVFKTMDKLSNLFFSQSKIVKIGKNIQPSTVAFILAGDLTVNLYT